jgi:hypothetical protein
MESKIPATQNNYEKAKREARAAYRNTGAAWSPAFQCHIAFNVAGFHHILWKQNERRSKREQIRRFALLCRAKPIIEQTKNVATHRQTTVLHIARRRGKKKTRVLKADFWSLVQKSRDITVTVVIRQLEGGQKHFFSIFSNRK